MCVRVRTCVVWVYEHVLLQPSRRWLIHQIMTVKRQQASLQFTSVEFFLTHWNTYYVLWYHISLVLKVQIKFVLKYAFSETNTLTSGLAKCMYEKKDENSDPTIVLQLYLEQTSSSVFIFLSIVQLQSLSEYDNGDTQLILCMSLCPAL